MMAGLALPSQDILIILLCDELHETSEHDWPTRPFLRGVVDFKYTDPVSSIILCSKYLFPFTLEIL